MTPPFNTPSKASYLFSGFHSATTSPFRRKLLMCKPCGFAGPQPQHALFGAYFSWRDLSLMVEISSGATAASVCQRVEDNAFHLLKCRAQTNPGTGAMRARRKVSAGGLSDCGRVAR